jgi:hypothetical protein
MARAILIALAALSFAAAPSRAQDLVIGGERIADAATMQAARTEGKLVLYSTYVTESFDHRPAAGRRPHCQEHSHQAPQGADLRSPGA